MNDYQKFLESKRHSIGNFGFKANYIPDIAFDFQKYIIEKELIKKIEINEQRANNKN